MAELRHVAANPSLLESIKAILILRDKNFRTQLLVIPMPIDLSRTIWNVLHSLRISRISNR